MRPSTPMSPRHRAFARLFVSLLLVAAQRNWLSLVMFSMMLPMALLMWARYWGRLAWVTLNHTPPRRKRKKRRKPRADQSADAMMEIDVEVVTDEPPAPNETAFAEEDEWSKDKAPYAMEPEINTPESTPGQPAVSSVTSYYEERAAREAKEREVEAAKLGIGVSGGRIEPSFREAMFVGMWSFLFQRGALRAWANMALMTFAGIFVLALLGIFRPPV